MPRTNPCRGSHLPALMKAMSLTNGRVLEFGCGMYSSPYLHWVCYPNRQLETFEDHPDWFDFIKRFESPWHKIHLVKDWSKTDLSGPVSVVLIDHDPITSWKRSYDVARLTHAEFVVCHDAENKAERKHNYEEVKPLFKYSIKCRKLMPHTIVFSNTHNLEGFDI